MVTVIEGIVSSFSSADAVLLAMFSQLQFLERFQGYTPTRMVDYDLILNSLAVIQSRFRSRRLTASATGTITSMPSVLSREAVEDPSLRDGVKLGDFTRRRLLDVCASKAGLPLSERKVCP